MNTNDYGRYPVSENEWELIPELEAMLKANEYPMRQGRPSFMYETAAPSRPSTIARKNTDLDSPYFGGNFNFLYNGGSNEATATFNTFLRYRKNFPDKLAFEARLREAVEAVWDKSAQIQLKDRSGNFSTAITLRFKFNIVKDRRNSNKVTDVHAKDTWASFVALENNREMTMRELNVFIGSKRNVLVHELGHVWGMLDEYDTSWIEKKFSPGHVGTGSPLLKDTLSLMNKGYQDSFGDTGEFRTRFYVHFGRALASAFWTVPEHVIPNIVNGRTMSKNIIGRIVLLKKNIAGDPPFTADVPPYNPQYTYFQIAKR